MKKLFVFIFILIIITGFPSEITEISSDIRNYELKLIEDPYDLNVLKNLTELYERLYDLGEKSSIKKAKKYMEDYMKISYDPYSQVKYGSILMKIGNTEWFVVSKLWFVFSGNSEMEKGIEREPENLELRLIRANISYNMLDFDFCRDNALIDYEYLLLKRDEINQEKTELIPEILYRAAYLRYIRGDIQYSLNYYNQIISSHKDSIYYFKARDAIKEIKGSDYSDD